MSKINLHEMFEARMTALSSKHAASEGDNGNAVISFEAGYTTALNDLQSKVDGLFDALELCELEMLTIDDHVNYHKMERYYTQERSVALNKLIHKIQQVLAEFYAPVANKNGQDVLTYKAPTGGTYDVVYGNKKAQVTVEKDEDLANVVKNKLGETK